jgi:hypothetical protein
LPYGSSVFSSSCSTLGKTRPEYACNARANPARNRIRKALPDASGEALHPVGNTAQRARERMLWRCLERTPRALEWSEASQPVFGQRGDELACNRHTRIRTNAAMSPPTAGAARSETALRRAGRRTRMTLGMGTREARQTPERMLKGHRERNVREPTRERRARMPVRGKRTPRARADDYQSGRDEMAPERARRGAVGKKRVTSGGRPIRARAHCGEYVQGAWSVRVARPIVRIPGGVWAKPPRASPTIAGTERDRTVSGRYGFSSTEASGDVAVTV